MRKKDIPSIKKSPNTRKEHRGFCTLNETSLMLAITKSHQQGHTNDGYNQVGQR